jgi:pimeloyl-ACP methyl ester carboxylesterase
LTCRKDQQQFVEGVKKAKLIVYEDIGHALHWQEPKRFADDLVAFISEHNSAK